MTNQLEALIAEMKAAATLSKNNTYGIDAVRFKAMVSDDNVLALIAALEQSQQKESVYDMLREDYELDKKGVGLADFVDWQAKKIAELEATPEREREKSRRVMSQNHRLEASKLVVKLPMLYGIDFCDSIVPDNTNGFLFYSEEVIAALKAAGITVQGDE